MNLVREPWIRVVMKDGASRLVSLEEIFKDGGNMADLAANPCQRVSLMRLLICIVQAALDGPKDEDEWHDCLTRIGPAALEYLDKWQNRFNLFGEHAFLQVDGLENTSNSLSDKIDFTLSSGNNTTLFDHAATKDGRVADNVDFANNLLVYQMFSPGGLIGSVLWENQETGRNCEHSPCLEGSMLHTIIRGEDLIATMRLNILTKEQIKTLPNMGWGRPCWELSSLSRHLLGEIASTYLGRLVPVSRAISSIAGDPRITLAAGTLYEKIPEQREPVGTVVEVGKGANEHLSYISVDPEKHPWRNLASILSLRRADKKGGAYCLENLRGIADGSFDIWTGGLVADKAKLVDMAEWSFTLPVEMLDTSILARYQSGVEAANYASFTVYSAVKKYEGLLKGDNGNNKTTSLWGSKAKNLFWGLLDSKYEVLERAVLEGQDAISSTWVPEIRDTLHAAYSQTCPHKTPRQILAYSQGLKIIDNWKGTTHE